MKTCCFRFDVDTHACMMRGMPALLGLARSLDVRFTFFVNMGRGFNRRITLAKAFRRLVRREKPGHVTAAAKLGLRDSLIAAALNPNAGPFAPETLRAAAAAGHEIGVHGGRNHAQWERDAHTWPESRVRSEILASLDAMRKYSILETTSFASPAWNSPACLKEILPSLGFHILADTYDASAREIVRAEKNLALVPTNVTPGAGRAGYLETLRLQGLDENGVVAHFKNQLREKGRFAVVYDHPFYAGIHGLPILRAMITAALDAGFKISTLREAVAANG
jgi:peptidoglycan/xylan/chitin deacetylase (PgdA/CDA1 family)